MRKRSIKQMFAASMSLVFGTLIVFAVFSTSGCKKDATVDNGNQELVNADADAMVAHIMAFKERMAYYHDNPGLKTGGQLYSAEDAVAELENLINYNFCYTSLNCNQKEMVKSQIVMPLDELMMISDPKLMEVYYNRMIDTIQNQIGRVSFVTKKLLLVNLELEEVTIEGDAIVSIGSLIGNGILGVLHNDDWWYGENLGTYPSNLYVPEDAASQLMQRVINTVIPVPPTGGRWIYTYIDDFYIEPTQDPIFVGTQTNYRDYKIFYATTNVAPITSVEKHLPMAEMSFYQGNYNDYAWDFESSTGKKLQNCKISGSPYTSPAYHIQHDLTLYLGYRTLVMDLNIDDILLY